MSSGYANQGVYLCMLFDYECCTYTWPSQYFLKLRIKNKGTIGMKLKTNPKFLKICEN